MIVYKTEAIMFVFYSECASPSDKTSKQGKDSNGDSNKDHIEDGIKCLICMVSIFSIILTVFDYVMR